MVQTFHSNKNDFFFMCQIWAYFNSFNSLQLNMHYILEEIFSACSVLISLKSYPEINFKMHTQIRILLSIVDLIIQNNLPIKNLY